MVKRCFKGHFSINDASATMAGHMNVHRIAPIRIKVHTKETGVTGKFLRRKADAEILSLYPNCVEEFLK